LPPLKCACPVRYRRKSRRGNDAQQGLKVTLAVWSTSAAAKSASPIVSSTICRTQMGFYFAEGLLDRIETRRILRKVATTLFPTASIASRTPATPVWAPRLSIMTMSLVEVRWQKPLWYCLLDWCLAADARAPHHWDGGCQRGPRVCPRPYMEEGAHCRTHLINKSHTVPCGCELPRIRFEVR
jgi:hypothetical protein